MNLQVEFQRAAADAQSLTRRPANDELLQLYALFKQATDGDNNGERPGGFDFKAIAKFDTWREQKGKEKDVAMHEYVSFVGRLKSEYT